MRTIKKLSFERVLSMVLIMLAVVCGGGAMAAGTIENPDPDNMSQDDPASDHEPADKDVNDRRSAGGEHDGQDLTGTRASATQLREGGLIDEERENEVTQLRPYKVPFMSLLAHVAKTIPVKEMIVKHARVGGETIDGKTTVDITGGDTIKLTKSNFSGNLLVFRKYDLISVPSMGGYKPGSQTEHNGEFLTLEVVERDKTGVTLCAINGPAAVEGQTGDEYDYQSVPNIPAGTYMLGMWNAMTESQLLVTPDNYQPREREVYLQKHGWNVEFTEEFEKALKKYPVKVANLLEDAGIKNDTRVERGYLMSPKAKRKRINDRGAVEDVFYSEGILTQIPNFYAIGDEYSLADLVAINMLQFTDFATSNRAFTLCGKKAVQRLENLNPGENRHIHLDMTKLDGVDLSFKTFKDTFGENNFIWDQTLDMMGLEDYMLVLDFDNMVHYIKEKQRSRTNDNSQGAGEINLSKTHWEYDTDAVALKGFNSIIVGPEGPIFNMVKQGITNYIVSAPNFPDTPSLNMKVALTKNVTIANGASAGSYEEGKVYIYNGTKWILYQGVDIAV